jgi:hypothetical protein
VPVLVEAGESFFAVIGYLDFETELIQNHGHESQYLWLVIDEQNNPWRVV